MAAEIEVSAAASASEATKKNETTVANTSDSSTELDFDAIGVKILQRYNINFRANPVNVARSFKYTD